MVEIEIGDVTGECFRIDEARIRVLSRIARNSARLLHRLTHRFATEIGGARRAFAFTKVHRDPKAPITLVLDRFYLAQAHGHTEPLAHIGVSFTLRRPLPAGFVQHEADHVLELWDSLGFGLLLHYIRLRDKGVGQNCTRRKRCDPVPFPEESSVTSDPPKKPSTDFEYDGPSKSSRKRAAHAAQDLGEELIRMRDSDLDVLNLPETLVDAVREARRITSRGGLARQRQFIGKLMRDIDLEPIKEFLGSRNKISAQETARFKRVEEWRERLLVEGAPALEELGRWRPGIDRDEWARRLSAAQAERTRTGATGPASRELFRALRALFDEPSPDPATPDP